jgi:hypothetical protein
MGRNLAGLKVWAAAGRHSNIAAAAIKWRLVEELSIERLG